MADRYFYLSEKGQKSLLEKLHALRDEIDEVKEHLNDKELGMTIANNIAFAKEEIRQVENLLVKTVHENEINHALGINMF